MEEKFEKYEEVRKGFSLFFGQQDFIGMLAKKADIPVMSKLLEEKATVTSMENFDHNI